MDGVHDLSGRAQRLPGIPRLALLALALPGCRTFPGAPVLAIQTAGGEEVGASTTHGVLFAGRTASRGMARVIAFFGDGPAVETGDVEETAPGLFSVPVQIALPAAEISVDALVPGEALRLAGRVEGRLWTARARVAAPEAGTPRIETSASVPGSGALAFRWESDRWRLAGLVAPASGGPCAVLGPETLWRFLFRPRPQGPPPFPPKRPDVR